VLAYHGRGIDLCRSQLAREFRVNCTAYKSLIAKHRLDVVRFKQLHRFGERRVRCAISREALDDHFHGEHRNKLDVFRENRRAIEATTRRKDLDGELEPDNPVLVRTADIRS
jgi:hypothetical protein